MNRIIIIILILMFSISIFGQIQQSKVEYWEAFGIDIRVSKIFKIYMEKQLRYEDRFSDLRADIMEGGVRIKIAKSFFTRFNYRYTIQRDKRKYRFDANIMGNIKLKKFRLSLRSRIQKEFLEDGVFTSTLVEFRNKVVLSYKINKQFFPYLGGEFFLGLGENKGVTDKTRLSFGLEWNVKKRFRIKFFYHLQKDAVKELNKINNIFGVKFNYSF